MKRKIIFAVLLLSFGAINASSDIKSLDKTCNYTCSLESEPITYKTLISAAVVKFSQDQQELDAKRIADNMKNMKDSDAYRYTYMGKANLTYGQFRTELETIYADQRTKTKNLLERSIALFGNSVADAVKIDNFNSSIHQQLSNALSQLDSTNLEGLFLRNSLGETLADHNRATGSFDLNYAISIIRTNAYRYKELAYKNHGYI